MPNKCLGEEEGWSVFNRNNVTTFGSSTVMCLYSVRLPWAPRELLSSVTHDYYALWWFLPMQTACTDYIYTWQSPSTCVICESPDFGWQRWSHFDLQSISNLFYCPYKMSRPRLYFPTVSFVLIHTSLCLSSPLQVCVHSHGSPGPAADGLPLSEHQPVCGELS